MIAILAAMLCAFFAACSVVCARFFFLEMRARKARGPSINRRTGASR